MVARPSDIPSPSNDNVARFRSHADRLRAQDELIARLVNRVAELEKRLNHIAAGCPIATRLERDR